MKLIVKQLSGG